MKQLLAKGIVLRRTNFGEADRIVTVLTPDHGKVRLMARGVRRIKSKLAGGVELFSVSDITFIAGKGDIGTLISARLDRHFGNIVHDLTRVQLGYELIKLTDRITEDHPEAEYFHLLQQVFEALDDPAVDEQLIRSWFQARLLRLAGHTPNLQTDTGGGKLQSDRTYGFDLDSMGFADQPEGAYGAPAIKVLRLLFATDSPAKLRQVKGIEAVLPVTTGLITSVFAIYLAPNK